MMKREKKVLAAAILAIVAIAAAFLSRSQGLEVETVAVAEQEITRTVLASGYFDAGEEREIVARYPLVLSEILVEAGDTVEKGQVLARADSSALEVEKRTLEAELSSLKAQLAASETNLPLQRSQAETAAAAAQETLAQAEREEAALAELFRSGAVPELEYRRAQSQLAAAQAQLQQAQAGLAEVKSAQNLLAQQRSQIDALSARLSLLEEQLSYHQVSAGVAGRVAEVYVKEGAVVGAGTPLFLLHSAELMIEAEVLAQDAPELKVGQRVIISGTVLKERELVGSLAKIHPRAVEKLSELGVTQRRVPVEINLEETPDSIRPGYPVDVEIVTAETKAPAVPKEAVFQLQGKDHVFKILNGKAALAPVETGLEGEDLVEIRSGLAAGDLVINNPPKELAEGTRIR
jgi:HlyD family secretion protein